MKEKYGDTSLSESKILSLIKEKEKPRMTKKSLMEYIKNPKKVVKKVIKKDMIKEQYENLEVPEGFTGMDLKFIFKYLETLRKSGLINMFGASPLLNWTKEDMERWLYGQKQDIESIEYQIEELKNDYEDDYEDDNESEIELLEEQLRIINYLLNNKQKIRDILIRTALKRIENGNGDMETRNVQRVFEKLAKESWVMWTTGIYGQ